MKIALVQFAPKFKDINANFNYVKEQIKSIEADIIVFPELSLSGYYFLSKDEILPYAIEFNSPEIIEIQELATKLNKIISFGFAEKCGDNIYNSATILFPDKELSKIYQKTHLFYKERDCFSEGETGFFVIEDKSRDIKIGTMICYDWRFPESARTLALLGADLIICPSNLVTSLWHKVMPARAIENKVYLAVANRIGTETNGGEELLFKGESAIYDFNGAELAKASVAEEEIIIAEIFPEKTRDKSFNDINDIFKDRRAGKYKL